MFDHTTNVTSISFQYNGLTQLRKAYKRQVSKMNEEEEEVKKHRGDSASPSTSNDYCKSPPAAQEIPWDVVVDDGDDDDKDDDFNFSPASPPLTQTTKGEEEEETAPPTLYVFPDSTVVLTPDGGEVRIPDRPASQPTGALYKGGESGALHKPRPRKPHEHRGV